MEQGGVKQISFETFYQDNYTRTYHYVMKKISNPFDAEDLTGNVFLYCYKNYEQYDPEKASLTTWLYLIVNSRIKNYYRDKKESIDLDEVSNTIIDNTPLLEKAVIMEEQRTVLADAIKTLPQRQQDIVVLKYFMERSSPEIAAELGITPGNVRVLLSRALDKIGKYYQEHME